MPQKLIRLTSDSGDGIFNGIFNEEIQIKEDSEIALQSLSVERLSSTLKITKDNNVVGFASVGALAADIFGNIVPHGVYDRSNTLEFFQNVTAAMNRECNAFLAGKEAQWGIQQSCSANDVGSSGRVSIAGILSPFYQIQKWGDVLLGSVQPGFMTFTSANRPVQLNLPNADAVSVWEEFQTDEYGMFREDDTTTGGGGTEPEFNESYVFGSEPFTKSTGAFRARFKRLNTDGAGTASFTMGLVKGTEGLNKLQGGQFNLADFHYAIRVNGHSTPMQYINKSGSSESDFKAGPTPVNHTTAAWRDQLNDVLDIRLGGGSITGLVVSQLNAGATPVRTPLAAMVDYDATADYYWVIALHEGKLKCVLDLVGVTLDPIGAGGENLKTSTNPDNAFDQSLTTGFSAITDLEIQPLSLGINPIFTPHADFDPIVAQYMGFKQGVLTGATILPELEMIPNDENGLPDLGTAYEQAQGYFFLADVGFDNSYDSDTYIIDTQTFTLDSYDSYGLDGRQRTSNSGGSRRNIIATIPVTEVPIAGTPNSIIQFEPATLNYIKIKNRGDIVTRQIRCRLLTGMYNDVKTEGLASIVLLIKE